MTDSGHEQFGFFITLRYNYSFVVCIPRSLLFFVGDFEWLKADISPYSDCFHVS